jgi:hypothetical protein
VILPFNTTDMDTLLAYASCSSFHMEDLLLLNSCNSMDISNNFISGDSCSTMDVNQLLDMNSSSALDASINDMNEASEQHNDNNETATTAINSNKWRTVSKPAPPAFRKPRPVLPKRGNGGGGGSGISSIPRPTRKLESNKRQSFDGGMNDDDDEPVDTSSNLPAITKSVVASSPTTLDTLSSSSSSSTSSRSPSTGDGEIDQHQDSQYCDEYRNDIVWVPSF